MKKKKKITLTQMIFIGMAIGLLVGVLFPGVAKNLRPISQIFIRLIKSIIVPLIFSTIVVGIAGHSNAKAVGRMGLKALVYFEIVTTIALFVGLFLVTLTKPGVGVDIRAAGPAEIVAKKQTLAETLVHIFPQNFFESAANGEVLQIVIFSVFFALALMIIKPEKKKVLLDVLDSLSETMFKYTGFVMRFAPFGVGAAISVVVGSRGIKVLLNLGLMVLTYYAAIALYIIVVLIPVCIICKLPIGKFFRSVKEPAIIAFSTTSSEAALPKALEAMEAFGVPRKIVAFVLPTGYSFNLDGTCIYLTLASTFIAQAAGVHMTFGQQLLMLFTFMFTSKGVAGIPRGSLVILAGSIASFGLPLEGVAILLGVDELMDMGRSAINVIGNCLASAVVARWEKELDPKALPADNGSPA